MPNIAVVIPMFGMEEYTDKCIQQLSLNYGTGEPIEILVVDDGSPVPYKNHKVNILRLEENSGFTNATNQGILWCADRFDYILLLNNDTEPHPGFLYELLQVMEKDESIGIAASVRYHPSKEGQPYELCGADIIRGYQHFTDKKTLEKAPEILDANWIPLASGLMRMKMIREVGLLDKRYRNHCSDSNYCIEVKIRGWKVVLVTNSIVTHHLSVTTTANKVKVEDDQRIFLERLAGLDYQKLMANMPLDGESKSWGRLTFEVYKK